MAAAEAPTEAQNEEIPNWKELPAEVMAAILQFAPHKRTDVKLVCQAWRAAVNAQITSVGMTAAELPCLQMLPAVQALVVRGTSKGRDASSSPTATAAANPWSCVRPSTMQRLKDLFLDDCPTAFLQLADHQAAAAVQQQVKTLDCKAHSSSSSSSSGNIDGDDDSRPLLTKLDVLVLMDLGCIAQALPTVLIGVRPLQALFDLSIVRCSFSTDASELAVLQQLPALRGLELVYCQLHQLPAAVCSCAGLTRLRIGGNLFDTLPGDMSKLTKLQVLDLSFNINLQSLGGGFSCLIALTALNLSGLDSMWRQSPAPPPPAVDGDEGNNIGDNDNAADVEGADDDAVFPAADADLAALPHMQQLQLLPELRSFSSLINLSLASNRNMRMLPASLSALTRLQVLDARHCGINFLNDELWECLGLRELLLSDNVLSALPDDISRLQKLEVLDIGHCRSLWQLPPALLSLSQLTHLTLATKAVGQNIIERLELRDPNPVHMVYDLDDDEDQYDGWGDEGWEANPPSDDDDVGSDVPSG